MLAGEQARHLHGEGRAARDDPAMREELPAGAPDGNRIDAMMAAEATVLEGEQHGEVARVDLLDLDGQAPAPVGGRVGAQQPVVAVEHGDGQRLGTRQRYRLRALPDDGERGRNGAGCQA